MPPLGTLSFVLTMIGWASYVPVAKSPALRRTMWPTWLIQIAALGVAVFALVRDSANVTVPLMLAVVAIGSFAIFVIVYFMILRIPRAAGRPEIGKTLRHIEVLGEDGKPVSPDDWVNKGPVLMIFFRGFW
jgi:hypothetical protein